MEVNVGKLRGSGVRAMSTHTHIKFVVFEYNYFGKSAFFYVCSLSNFMINKPYL